MTRAAKEAGAVFGSIAVKKVLSNPNQAEQELLKNTQAVKGATGKLIELIKNPDIKEAVTFAQTLPPPVQAGVLYLWLGFGQKTIKELGL